MTSYNKALKFDVLSKFTKYFSRRIVYLLRKTFLNEELKFPLEIWKNASWKLELQGSPEEKQQPDSSSCHVMREGVCVCLFLSVSSVWHK